jgi:predicted transcriptional regulator of viral defense system
MSTGFDRWSPLDGRKIPLGTFTAARAKEAGLSHWKLASLVETGAIERVARGVYQSEDQFRDDIFIQQLRRPKTVYSHGTALFLYELTDRAPIFLTVTVPAGYNTKTMLSEGMRVHSVKPEWYSSDITKLRTDFGHSVYVYSLERTIVDCVRTRNRMDAEYFAVALKRYVYRRDCNISELMVIAKRFMVQNEMKFYMEILL